MNSPRYCDIDNRTGYLGHLVMDRAERPDGCLVQLVGPGTPAAEAGLKPGDVIKTVNGKTVTGRKSLEEVLAGTEPKQSAQLVITRDGAEQTLTAKLRRYPLQVIKPEGDDPLSMLLTLQQFDQEKLGEQPNKYEKKDDEEADKRKVAEENDRLYNEFINDELKGVNLRTTNWKLVSSDQLQAQFRRELPEKGLEITKTYSLAKVPEASQGDADFPAYHLIFKIEIRNRGENVRKVAYRLDGPNGLPTEGSWYVWRVTRSGGSGLRDCISSFGNGTPDMTGAMKLSADVPDVLLRPDTLPDRLLTFIGVDAQYFSAVLKPDRTNPADVWFEGLLPIRVGRPDVKRPNLTNSSCRLMSTVKDLRPGEVLTHQFKVFAGPKKPALLQNKEYRLGELVYFGWPIFAVVAEFLTVILHFFYSIVHNYGLAIILLTVLVRGCMFPVSRKQAIGQQKMAQLQPEMKKIQEKYKNNVEARNKAMHELYSKHGYNPLSGCLPLFIQLPVFIGLYKSLQVAIELAMPPCFRLRFAGARTWPLPTCSSIGKTSCQPWWSGTSGRISICCLLSRSR